MTILYILAFIGAVTVIRAAARLVRVMLGDRSGASGRFGHFETGE